MTIAAELTLQIARAAQTRPDAVRTPTGWSFWPDGGTASWPEARALLAATPKPVFVAPLIEPGTLGIFTLGQFPEPVRKQLTSQLANQVAYYTEKLDALKLGEDATLRFVPATEECILTVPELIQWASDYALAVGVSLGPSPDPRVGRIIVRPPGGGRAPIGA